MADFLSRLKRGEQLLSDGGMGSTLISLGLDAGDCPERLNLDEPDVLKKIAQEYFDAGSDMIHTNSFGGSPIKLKQYGLDSKARDINARAVEQVRKVVRHDVIVAASIGPCGRMLEPYGDLSEEELFEAFVIQIAAVVDAGADTVTIETMTDLNEAVIVLKAARTVDQSIPVLTTLTFDKTAKGFFTMMGNSVTDCVDRLTESGATGTGSNCGNGSELMVEIARDFKAVAQMPVMIQSNAGLPEFVYGKLTYSETPEFMGERVAAMLDLGVNIIGGCCGTTPDHIRLFRKLIDRR